MVNKSFYLLAGMLISGALSLVADSVVYTCNFGNGAKDISTYYQKAPRASFKVQSDGKSVIIKVTPAPERKLSGIKLKQRPKLSAKTLYKISAEVKGNGRGFIGVFGPAKWNYSQKILLSEKKWKVVEVEYFMPRSESIGIYTFAWKPKQGQYFCVRNIRVEKKEIENLSDSPVAPVWIEAESCTVFRAATIKTDAEASSGKFTFGKRWYGLADIDIPATQKPLYFWLRVKSFGENTAVQLYSSRFNAGQKSIPHDGKWHWLKFGPIDRLQAGCFLTVCPAGGTNVAAGLDAIVLATDSRTVPEKVKPQNLKNGIVAVGKAKTAPGIDGVLDDECWKNTIAIKPFVLQRQNSFAKAQTVARLTYDKENLYFSFKCYEPCLDPKANVLHKFQRNIKRNDDLDIFKDDCVLILLAPRGAKQGFYDLVINANGKILDASYPAPKFWSGRDLKWQSGAKVKTVTGNGFWIVEGSIPLKSFSKGADKKRWGMLVGRIRQAEKEISAWQPLQSGFHMPSSLGEITFENSVPAIDLQSMGQFRRGNNNMCLNLTQPFKTMLKTRIMVLPSGKKAGIFNQQFNAETKTLNPEYNVSTGDEVAFQYSVVDPNNFINWCKSPVYQIKVNSSTLKAELDEKSLKLFINGKLYRQNCQLQKGINIVALEVKEPTILSLAAGKTAIPLSGAWNFSKQKQNDWKGNNFNSSGWNKVVLKNGKFTTPGYYRKLIVLEQSEIWPNWEKEGLTLCRDSLQPLYFFSKGIQGIKAKDYKITVEVPEAVKIIGASGFYRQNMGMRFKALGTTLRKGKIFNKYEYVIPGGVSFKKKMPFWHSIAMFMKADGKAVASSAMYYYCSADDGFVQEVPRKLMLNFVSSPKGKQPKDIIIQMWPGYLHYLNDIELRKAMLQEQALMGVNQGGNVSGFGIKKFVLMDFASWSIDCRSYLKKYPDHALIDFKGHRRIALSKGGRFNNICTSVLLSQPDALKFLKNSVIQYTKSKNAYNVIWDYEEDVFESYIACYCPRCLKAFRKKYNIREDCLTPEIIKKKYAGQWIDFTTGRMAEMASLFNQYVHAAGTGAIFSIYSAYQSELSKRQYSIDWSKLAGKIDLGSCGYGRPLKDMTATINALGKTPATFGAIVYPYRVSERNFPTFCNKAKILRRILDSRKGMLIYTFNNLDGRTFSELGKVSRLVAEYESLILKGSVAKDAVSIEGLIPDDCYAFTDSKGKRLIALFNTYAKPKTFRLKVKDLNCGKKLYDYYAGKLKINGSVVAGVISKKDVKVFVIE
jgi:hypothetical protein